jgi:hypothetical protein
MKPRNPYAGMPASLKIGNFRFVIEMMEAGDASADRTFGHMNPVHQKIRVAPDMSAQNLADTFLHETLHAIHWIFALDDDSDEEDFTLFGAHGLCQLWQDNPDAMAWWVSINRQAA